MADERQTITTEQNDGAQAAATTNGHGPIRDSGSPPLSKPRAPAPAEAPPTGPSSASEKPAGAGKMTSGTKLLIGSLALVALALAILFGTRFYLFNRVHVSTDDAYVTGNLINVSPLISGTLTQLTVNEGDQVRKGQTIAQLDTSGPLATLRQAKAAYAAALSEIPQAKSNLAFQKAETAAAVRRAQSGIGQQQARTQGAQAQVRLAAGQTENQVLQAQAQIRAARALAQQSEAQVGTARSGVAAYRQAVQTAQRGVQSLQAKVPAAQADVDKTSKDEARYRKLLQSEAVTQQQYDVVADQYATAQANRNALDQQIAQAQSQVKQAQANVDQSLAQLAAAKDAARAGVQQVGVAQAGFGIAQANLAQVPVQQLNQQATATQNSQAEADLSTAQAGQTQVQLRQQQIATATAQAEQARAALTNAEILYQDCFIRAPSDGTVINKAANVGASMSPGQTIVTLTQGNRVYVTANFKETQIGDIRPGQPVEIDVDAFPGVKFKGVVGAINGATGAATSLLPPDNATGNFTKVVQRLPIKLALIPGDGSGEATAQDMGMLRPGMSVNATIDISDKTPHPERVPAGYDQGDSGTGAIGGGSPTGSVGGEAAAGAAGATGAAAPAAPGASSADNATGNTANAGNVSGANAPAANRSATNPAIRTAVGPAISVPATGANTSASPANLTNPAAMPAGAQNANPAANSAPAGTAGASSAGGGQ